MMYNEEDIGVIAFCKSIADANSTCLSRKIGAIITNVKREFLSIGVNHPEHYRSCSQRNPNGELICPRRFFNFKSGGGMIICDAVHAEVDAIRNFEKKLLSKENLPRRKGDLYMYMNCPIPCLGCTYEIVSYNIIRKKVQEKIKRIYCIDSLLKYKNSDEYHFFKSYSFLTKNNIEIIEIPQENLPF